MDLQTTETIRRFFDVTSQGRSGTSLMNLILKAQQMDTGLFRKYDFGMLGNQGEYGSFAPPKIDIRNMKVPVLMVQGDSDAYADLEDNKVVAKILSDSGSLVK